MGFQIKAMDSEQEELQFLGFYGIFKESLKIILTWPKIFLQITLAFILPHSCLHLAKNLVSKVIISNIFHNSSTLANNQVGSPTYEHVSNSIYSEWATYWIITAIYFIFSIVLSLFAVSATIYAVACIYTGKDVTFRKVVSVVPKVWKRLMITFLCNFCLVIAYIFAILVVVVMYTFIYFMFFYDPQNSSVANVARTISIITSIVSILLMIGFFYLAMIWQLANVVSVMELNNCGVKALKKSKELIKGKMGTSFAIFLVMNLGATPLYLMIQQLATYGVVQRICYGILSIGLWTFVSLFALVVQTILYLVCKSYHHESIDKSSLAGQLDVYLGEYVPLKSEDAIQLEKLHV